MRHPSFEGRSAAGGSGADLRRAYPPRVRRRADPGAPASPAGASACDATLASESISRNAVFAFLGQLATATFTAILTLYLVRALGPTGYGVFTLALAVGGLFMLPADLGINGSMARFIAERRGDRRAIGGIVADALQLKLVLAVVVCVALVAAAGPIADAYDSPAMEWPLRGIALAGLGTGLMALFAYSFSAQGVNTLRFRLTLGESIVETGASIALVALGTGATGAAFGRAAGYLFAGVVGLVMTVRLLGRSSLVRGPLLGDGVRRIARYAGVLALVDGAFRLFEEIDALLIGAFLGVASVGLFQAPLRLVSFLHYPGLALSIAVAPRVARHAQHAPSVGALTGSLRWLVVFQAVLIAPLAVWAEPIIDLLLGSAYDESANALRALAPFAFLAGLAPLLSTAANFLGEGRRRIPIAIVALLVNVAIDVVLLPRIGIVGAGIGNSAAFALYVPGHLWICWRVLRFPLVPLLVTTGRALLAAGAMSGALLAFGTTDLSAVDWIAGAAAGIAAFAVALFVSREVRVGDVRTGYALVRSRFAR